MNDKALPADNDSARVSGNRQKSLLSSVSKPEEQPDSRLLEGISLALKLPIPESDDYWRLTAGPLRPKKKGLLGFFKKKELSEEELNELRQAAERAPGTARVKIQKFRSKYADNKTLVMLTAVCTANMVMSSSNRKDVLETLRSATKDAAAVLVNDGISLFNCEAFFDIYFRYLTNIKRLQATKYKQIRDVFSHQRIKKDLARAFNVCDSLLEEKDRVMKLLNRIKSDLKSSHYSIPWRFYDIRMAAKKVELQDLRAVCGPAEAGELFAYSMALTDMFARIPILSPLVESILKLIPEENISFILKKRAILISQAFTQLNLAIQEENFKRKRKLGRQIYKSAKADLHRIINRPVKQGFEAGPYFSISRVTIMTFGMYNDMEQNEMLNTSLKAMNEVARLDESKKRAFRKAAIKLNTKISNLLSD